MEVEDGWHLDPFGLHEHRYFSRGKPTKLVRDDGRESYDEPPADAPHVDATAADSLRAVPASARTPTQVASMSPKASGPPQASVPPPPKGVPPRRRRGIVLAVGVIALIVVVGVAYAVIADGSKTPHAVTTGARARASEPTTTAPVTSTTIASPEQAWMKKHFALVKEVVAYVILSRGATLTFTVITVQDATICSHFQDVIEDVQQSPPYPTATVAAQLAGGMAHFLAATQTCTHITTSPPPTNTTLREQDLTEGQHTFTTALHAMIADVGLKSP